MRFVSLKIRTNAQVAAPPQPSVSKSHEIANLRVCLALLRVYRSVPLRHQDLDLAVALTPFWPMLRRQRRLLLDAVAGVPASMDRGKGRRLSGTDAAREHIERWRADCAGQRGHLPQAAPPTAVLEVLGEALVRRDSRFRSLFDALQADLEACVLRSTLAVDRTVTLLAELLGLTDVERRYLSLAASVYVSTVGTSPFTAATGDARLVQALQAALAPAAEHEVRAMLRRGCMLFRSGLLDGSSFAQRRDMEDVLRLSRQGMLLLSAPVKNASDMAALILKPVGAAPEAEQLTWPHLEERTLLLQAALARALATHRRGVNILLYGAPGTGKTRYAIQLLHRVGARGFSVTDTDAHGDPAPRDVRLGSLLLTQVFAPPGSSIVLLDEAEDVFQAEYNNPLGRMFGRRDESKSWINNLLQSNSHPVIWISNRIDHLDAAYLRRFTYCLEFPETPRRVRREVVRRHLAPLGCSDAVLEAVAASPQVSPALVASAASFSQLACLSGERADGAVTLMLGDMVNAMGGDLRPALPERSTRFDLRYLNPRGAVSAQAVTAGLERLGQGRLLVSGPPGTGKTQLAAEIGQRLGRELVYRTASDINSMWFGQSERNVAQMFRECDPRGEVLFLDEADTLLSSREGSGHRAEVAVTAEFLRHLEAFQGVFVCATNFGRQLDAALLRRFEYRLELLPLDAGQREALFRETALGWDARGTPPELAPEVAARLHRLDQLTPGDFANVVRRVRALQLSLDAAAWLGELEAEHAAKPGAARSGIGFV